MSEMSREAREAYRNYHRQYMKEWRAKPGNKEKERAWRRNYWERRAQKEKQTQ